MKYRVRFSDDPGSEDTYDREPGDEQDVAADFAQQNHWAGDRDPTRDVTVIDEAGNTTEWAIEAEVVWTAWEKV